VNYPMIISCSNTVNNPHTVRFGEPPLCLNYTQDNTSILHTVNEEIILYYDLSLRLLDNPQAMACDDQMHD
jgi:hypothetical protein